MGENKHSVKGYKYFIAPLHALYVSLTCLVVVGSLARVKYTNMSNHNRGDQVRGIVERKGTKERNTGDTNTSTGVRHGDAVPLELFQEEFLNV